MNRVPSQGEQDFWSLGTGFGTCSPLSEELFPGSSPAELSGPTSAPQRGPPDLPHLKTPPSSVSLISSTPEMLIRLFAGLFSASVSGM